MSKVYGAHYRANSKNKAKDRRGSHNFQRGKYKRQWAITERNRLHKRQRHMSLHPEDRQALAALKKLLNNG